MKHSHAVDLVAKLLTVTQKFRSNAAYELGEDETMQKVLANVGPWVFDDAYKLIPLLSQMLALADSGEKIEPMSFYNLMAIVHRQEPMLATVAEGMYEIGFPQPDLKLIVMGWEPE